MMLCMMHGSVEYCMRSHVVGAVHICMCIYCSPLLACAYAGPSCTDVKWRVYETLQHEQNGGSGGLGHG